MLAARPLVVVIDSHLEERDQIAAALEPHYRVRDYADVEEAHVRMSGKDPAVLVVDERNRRRSRGELVHSLRNRFRQVPIVLCGTQVDVDDGADVALIKPFRRSQLVNAISSLTNRRIEGSWQDLPNPHPATLRRTLETFNGLGELLATGEELAYQQVVETCDPLVDAVTDSQYKLLLAGIRGHDNLAYVHSLRVATMLALFGYHIGLREEPLLILATGGLLHDIGKMSLNQDIIDKPGPLTAEEKAVVRQHVDGTIEYLRDHSDVPKGVITIASQHHERLDGSGYPKGLRGKHLNDLARMSAIVDVFAALTEERRHRPARSPEATFAMMTTEMQGSLDQRLLKMFRDLLLDAGAASWATA